MTKTKSTKRALLTSGLALLMCVSMLIGSTFAWFTDSVTSSGNIIKSGTLDVEMYWAKGNEDPNADATTWTDASEGAIFDCDLWEPGYTEVRHIKIANEGTLALKYQLNILANGEVSKLADVIDVYYLDPATQLADRADISAEKKLGTLTEVLANISTTASGNLPAGENHTITLALKMQESAGNEYQGLAIGSDFSVQLLATQLTSETDSFDDQYDKDAEYAVNVSTADELAAALATGGNIVLTADIEADSTFYVNAGVTVNLDLNGKTITVNSGYAFSLIDCNMTVKNGTIEAKNHYTFNVGSSINSIPANLTIESGTYKGIYTAVNLCYGTVTINDGYFESSVYSNGSYYTLNCIDRIYTAGNADMIVKGGTFNNFNPANNVSEGAGTNFCADGYTATENSDGTWTVAFDGAAVSTADALANAIAAGDNIILTADIEADSTIYVPAGVTVNLDLNGKTLSSTNNVAAASSAITNKGTLTIKNGTVTYQGVGDTTYGYATNTITNSGDLTIDGATIINTTNAGSSCAIDNANGSKLTVKSGKIESVKNAIRLQGGSDVTVNGGEVTSSTGHAIIIHLLNSNATNLTITGGTITTLMAPSDDWLALYSYAYGNNTFAGTTVTISGGTFNGTVGLGAGNKTATETVTITGGTFNGKVGRYLANNGWEDITY